MKNTIQEINKLIELNLYEDAFKLIDKQNIPDDFKKYLVILKSRYNQNEIDYSVLGIIQKAMYETTKNEIIVGLQNFTMNALAKYFRSIEEKNYAFVDKELNPNFTMSSFTIVVYYKGEFQEIKFISTWWKNKIFIDKVLVKEKIGIFNPVQKLDFSIPFNLKKTPARLVIIFNFLFGGINKIKLFIDEIKILETNIEIEY